VTGDLYISGSVFYEGGDGLGTVWRLDRSGLLTIVTGGTRSFDGNCAPAPRGGAARLTPLGGTYGVTLDPSRARLYISETDCGRIDSVDLGAGRADTRHASVGS
jgi:sugar lactone lactonase YvrE